MQHPKPKSGILLTNTGTPSAPTPKAVRAYLREFLSDKRVVKIPRLIWLPILYGLVLPFRPKRSVKLYEKIWTAQGSPMRVFMQKIAVSLQNKLGMPVEVGMNYGTPSIQQALKNLQDQQVEEIAVIPLFPQYSDTTTASSFDRVNHELKKAKPTPTLYFIKDYATNPNYIRALANTIQQHGIAEHLLISFHGIPKRFVQSGDPYQQQCEQTANLLAQKLKLSKQQWTLCYQSQFGYDEWLKPSTQQLLTELPTQGVKNIAVVCPGFSVDCLETLEEIAIRGKEIFLEHGGESLRYIPALNDSDAQVEMLSVILSRVLS